MSTNSSSCPPDPRLDWRPSRWLCAALVGLGALGSLSIALSALPGALCPPAMVLSLAAGVAGARREGARPSLALRFVVDGSLRLGPDARARRFTRVRVRMLGPVAWLEARGSAGSVLRLAWWPDTIAGDAGRVLRLAAAGAFDPAIRARAPTFATIPG